MGHHGVATSDDCVKRLDLDKGLTASPKSSEEVELKNLLLEQALLEEMLAQQELEEQLTRVSQEISILKEPVEQVRSYVNRSVAASSDLAPSVLVGF